MDKVVRVNKNIQIGELGTLSQAISARYDECKDKLATDAVLTAVMAEEKKESEAIITAINRTKNASRLDELDSSRDTALTTLFDTVKAYSLLGAAADKQKASEIAKIIEKYKGIAHLNNANESAQIASMLEDLSAESAKVNLEGLTNLNDAIESLRVAENAFLAGVKALEEQKIALGDNASSIKKRLIAVLNDKLVPYLNIASSVISEEYSPFADSVAILNQKANAVVIQRAKR